MKYLLRACAYACVYMWYCDNKTFDWTPWPRFEVISLHCLLSVRTMEWPTGWMNALYFSIHSFIHFLWLCVEWNTWVFQCHLSIPLFWDMVSYWLTDQGAPGIYLSPPPWCWPWLHVCTTMPDIILKKYFIFWDYDGIIIFSFPLLPLNPSLYPSFFFVKLMASSPLLFVTCIYYIHIYH